MAEEETLAPGEVPDTQSFIQSKKGQAIILVVLAVLVAGVWGAVWFRSSGADAPDIKMVETKPTASTVPTAQPGATPGSSAGSPGAGVTPSAESFPDSGQTGSTSDAEALPADLSSEEAERLKALQDRVYDNRDPFEGEKAK